MSDYWLGPYGIRVPAVIDYCTAADGYNKLYKDGSTTLCQVLKPLTKTEYLEQYCELKNGYFYWKC